jgi:hypothetical protein
MGDGLFPLLIFTTPERRRAEITERLLPAVVPGSVVERLAFSAVLAGQQISNREQSELKIVKEAAARFVNADDLKANGRTLYGIYAGLPESVRKTITFNTGSSGQKPDGRRKPGEEIDAALKEQEIKEKQTLGRKA